jgi:transposase
LAAGKKNAANLNAHLVFLDESGLLMAPLLRRTWARRGQTPIIYQRTRAREKVSAIGVLSLSPTGRRVGLYFSLLPNQNVDAKVLADFLPQLLRHLRGHVILIWDRLSCHRARDVQAVCARLPRLHLEYFPPYAPELNPVEQVWSYLKKNPLANLAAQNAWELAVDAELSLDKMQRRPSLLRAFLKATPLFSCRE